MMRSTNLLTIILSTVWAIFLYDVKGWKIKQSNRNRIEEFGIWYWRKIPEILCKDYRTNESVL